MTTCCIIWSNKRGPANYLICMSAVGVSQMSEVRGHLSVIGVASSEYSGLMTVCMQVSIISVNSTFIAQSSPPHWMASMMPTMSMFQVCQQVRFAKVLQAY